jgi:hypothetical protein
VTRAGVGLWARRAGEEVWRWVGHTEARGTGGRSAGGGERSRAVEEDRENGGGSAPEKIIRGGA